MNHFFNLYFFLTCIFNIFFHLILIQVLKNLSFLEHVAFHINFNFFMFTKLDIIIIIINV